MFPVMEWAEIQQKTPFESDGVFFFWIVNKPLSNKFYVKDLTFENTIDFMLDLWYIYNRFMFAFFGGIVCTENL